MLHIHSVRPFLDVLAMGCNKTSMILVLLFYVYLPVSSSKLTTLLKDTNLTSLGERLANLEQTIERRLNATERVVGQLLTGKDNANLEAIDVLALRSGKFRSTFFLQLLLQLLQKKKMHRKLQRYILPQQSSLLINL